MTRVRVGFGVPVPDEVRLEDDAASAGSQGAERIPIGASKILSVESETPKGGSNRGVDVVEWLVGARIIEQASSRSASSGKAFPGP
jgi:hypothetical protein